jgi:hypothetical protein
MDETAQAHAEDTQAQHEIDTLRRSIEDFLANDGFATRRTHPRTRSALQDAVVWLKHDSDHIVAVWD